MEPIARANQTVSTNEPVFRRAMKRVAGKKGRRMYRQWHKLAACLGFRAAVLCVLLGVARRTLSRWFGLNARLQVWVKNEFCPMGVYLRPGASDWRVFRQIFVDNEYAPFCEKIKDARVVVDAGANIGLSAVYFLEKYRGAECLCIEPEHENFLLCVKNVRRYGQRVKVLRKALWSERAQLALLGVGRPGEEWGIRTVKESASVETADGISMTELLTEQLKGKEVSILKVDIEGAESEVFRDGGEKWLEKVKNMCIEFHGQECQEAVMKQFEQFDYEHGVSGELTLFWNIVRRGRGQQG
jgi:FkbM family methyltransferase